MNISNIKDYDSIYICTDAIGKFVNLLPSIQKKFFLFSGDSTLSLSKNNFPNEIKTILKNKNLVRWYAQNLDFHDSRLECLPLGLDYHTGYENPNFFKSKKLFPLEQEEEIFRISSESLPLPKRELKIYANWHFHLDREIGSSVMIRLIRISVFLSQTELKDSSLIETYHLTLLLAVH